MKNRINFKTLTIIAIIIICSWNPTKAIETDTIPTTEGILIIHFLGHGSLMFEFVGKIIHIDPFSELTDYKTLPKADLILVTHQHGDHLDSTALENIYKVNTIIYWTEECQKSSKLQKPSIILKNGDKVDLIGIAVEAVPAYNIINRRPDGTPFHPAGEGNGYILTFGNQRVYVAGDTEDIPEMTNLGKIDIAFLPVNLPYTMTPEMFLAAAKMVKPIILYPYHYGKTNMQKVLVLLKDEKQIEVRIRKME